MTPTSTKETKETKKSPASTASTTHTSPLTPAEEDRLLSFAADVVPLYRRFGSLTPALA
jgi:hypothetical protein